MKCKILKRLEYDKKKWSQKNLDSKKNEIKFE